MFVGIDDLRVRTWFRVVENLTVDVLLGSFFIYRCIGGIFQSEHKVVPWHSHTLSVIASSQTVRSLFSDTSVLSVGLTHAAISNDVNQDEEEERFHLFGVFSQIKILPFT